MGPRTNPCVVPRARPLRAHFSDATRVRDSACVASESWARTGRARGTTLGVVLTPLPCRGDVRMDGYAERTCAVRSPIPLQTGVRREEGKGCRHAPALPSPSPGFRYRGRVGGRVPPPFVLQMRGARDWDTCALPFAQVGWAWSVLCPLHPPARPPLRGLRHSLRPRLGRRNLACARAQPRPLRLTPTSPSRPHPFATEPGPVHPRPPGCEQRGGGSWEGVEAKWSGEGDAMAMACPCAAGCVLPALLST